VSNLVKQMSDRPSNGKSRVAVAPPKSSLRFVTPTVAIEDGEYECGDAPDGSPMSGRFTAVWVKQDGRWLLDSLREAVTAGPRVDKHLRPLEWLLGEWVAETDDAVMLVSARPSEDGGATTATERIAWNADDGELKSWTFDSQDGRSESSWTRDGKGWRVETKEIMDDEQTATTVAMITPDGRGQHVWEVKSSKVGDETVPPQRVTFRRAPE
jgi:hypothetical protein